jgi:hypothetical protein
LVLIREAAAVAVMLALLRRYDLERRQGEQS